MCLDLSHRYCMHINNTDGIYPLWKSSWMQSVKLCMSVILYYSHWHDLLPLQNSEVAQRHISRATAVVIVLQWDIHQWLKHYLRIRIWCGLSRHVVLLLTPGARSTVIPASRLFSPSSLSSLFSHQILYKQSPIPSIFSCFSLGRSRTLFTQSSHLPRLLSFLYLLGITSVWPPIPSSWPCLQPIRCTAPVT